MGAPAMTHQAKFGLGVTGSAVNEPYEFRSENIAKQGTHVETDGARGTRSRPSENVNDGPYTVGGPVTLVVNGVEYDALLPKILGADESTDVFALAETLPDFVCQIDRKTKVFAYSGCKINKARFYSSRGNPLLVDLDIQGKQAGAYAGTTFTEGNPGNSGTFPSLTLSVVAPYMHHELVLTIGGTVYAVDNWELVVDNALILDRIDNSQTRTELPESDRVITMAGDFHYPTDETSLLRVATAGVAATAVFTKGGRSLTFSMVKIQTPDKDPNAPARNQEIGFRREFNCRQTASTKELVVTNDSAP